MFVTAFYAILDAPSKILRFSNAGHNPPVLFYSTTTDYEVLTIKGIVLGTL